MNRPLLLTFLGIMTLQLTMAQIPYQDAVTLKRYARPSGPDIKFQSLDDGNEDYIKILLKYVDLPVGQSEMTKQELFTYFETEKNVFLTEYLTAGGGISTAVEPQPFNTGEALLGSAVSGFSISNIADGLAKFLVERTKQELTMAFFEQFKQDLIQFQELRLLFPHTHTLLLSLGDEIYNFSGYINMLRETFQEDLKTIIPNLRTYLRSDLLSDYFTQKPLLKDILDNALLVAEELQNGRHPGDVLTVLKDHNRNNTNIHNFGPSLELLDLFSQSLRSTTEDRYWINPDELKELFKGDDLITLNIYLGLLYQQGKDINFTGATSQKTFREVLHEVKSTPQLYSTNIGPIKEYLKTLVGSAQRVGQSLRMIKASNAKAQEKSTYAQHYEFYTASIDLLEHSLSLGDIPILKDAINLNKADFERYFDLAHVAGDLYLDVREKQYFGAILHLQSALEKSIFAEAELNTFYTDRLNALQQDIQALLPKLTSANGNAVSDVGEFLAKHVFFKQQRTYKALRENLNDLKEGSLSAGEIENMVKNLDAMAKAITSNKNTVLSDLVRAYQGVLPKVLKYGNLAASVAQAENSEEVKKIIESIALPAGSASIKKRSQCNVALNAYVGLDIGQEKNGDTGDFNLTAGINAPIGVALSWGSYERIEVNTFKERGSHTAFLSLVDIGAFTSFRFGDNKTEELPEIKIENIFAPGLYYVRGLPKLPISWGIGGQLGPQLRDITSSTADLEDGLSFTAKAFIAVDIPLLNFYTKTR